MHGVGRGRDIDGMKGIGIWKVASWRSFGLLKDLRNTKPQTPRSLVRELPTRLPVLCGDL